MTRRLPARKGGGAGFPTGIPDDSRLHAVVFEYAPDAQFLVDGAGKILAANAQVEVMFGHPRLELLGKNVEMLIPARFTERHAEHRLSYMASPRLRPMGTGMELFGRRADGSEIPVDIMLSPLDTDRGPLALAVVRDVTERRRMEEEARRTRETYFKELHHRVKNNLQVISSLLFIQSQRTGDAALSEVLNESRNRVLSIALVHEKLYRSPDLGSIDMADYIDDLVHDLFRSYGARSDLVRLDLDVERVRMGIDTAIPVALIVNELVSNVFKHAFPEGARGRVGIRLARTAGPVFLLRVEDNGVGMAPDEDWGRGPSLGLSLVRDLTRQLEGEVQLITGAGTGFHLVLREAQYRERS